MQTLPIFPFFQASLGSLKSLKLNLPANSRAFSLDIGLLIGTFSLRKIKNHLCTALLSSSYFSGFTLFEIRPLLYFSKILSQFFFHVDKVFFGTPKREATSLWGVPFSNSLSALYFILYDLFSARCFVATEAMTVKFQNVDKQCIR